MESKENKYKKIQCWAKMLGNCNNSQSKEHIVSRGLLKDSLSLDNFIMVYGIGSNETKKIGTSSLTSKMLCSYHNSKLSDLDSEAIKTFNGLKRFLEIPREYKTGKLTNFVGLKFDGSLLERWFLKTTINILYCPPHNLKTPQKELVEIVFGLRQYPKKVGLCMSAYQGGQWLNNDYDLKFVPILNSQNQYEFAAFEFAGWRFIISLTDSTIPSPLSLDTTNPYAPFDKFLQDLSKSTLTYHLNKMVLKIGDSNVMEISFQW